MSPSAINIHIIGCRDVFQWEAKIKGQDDDYQQLSAVVSISKNDLSALGIKSGARVKLKNDAGTVVVQATSGSGLPKGVVAMPISPYLNSLINYSNIKRVEVLAEATDENITPLSQISAKGDG